MVIACGSAWRVAPRLVTVQAQVHPPAGAQCEVPSFCIGRAFAPWIIRTRHGPQLEEKAACALQVEAPASGGSIHG